MNAESQSIQRIYLVLLLLHTLAASFIWGINTLFLLDAGLSNAGAFAANAFFTAGQVLFEVPTGVVADIRGRRVSYLLGTLTLTIATLLYLWMWRLHAPLWAWALASMLLGLGFTFFSGAVEAWLVDALTATGFTGHLDAVFAKGQVVEGIAMLTGSVAGGFIAQATNLGVPYLVRAGILVITFVTALILMRDTGFERKRGRPIAQMKQVLRGALDYGLRNRPARWVMLAAPFAGGVTIFGFYAAQPYLLQLYAKPKAYGIAGLAAAVFAAAQIAGGLLVNYLARMFRRRTTVLLTSTVLSVVVLALLAVLQSFWMAIALLVFWSLIFAASTPVRQAYLNGLIESDQRATVLSFDSLLASTGGVLFQPPLGRVADVWGYPASYGCSAVIQALAIPFLWLSRREQPKSDAMTSD